MKDWIKSEKNIMLLLIVFIGFIITINNVAYGATEDKKIEIIPRASYTQASLMNWTTFIKVANTYYGGNQNWLTSAGVS